MNSAQVFHCLLLAINHYKAHPFNNSGNARGIMANSKPYVLADHSTCSRNSIGFSGPSNLNDHSLIDWVSRSALLFSCLGLTLSCLPLLLIVRDVPRGTLCIAWLSCCGGWFAADNVLRTAPGGAGCAAGRSLAFGTRGLRRTLSLLACYSRDSDTPLRDPTRRNRRVLLDNFTRDRTDRPLSLLACYTRYSPSITPGLS